MPLVLPMEKCPGGKFPARPTEGWRGIMTWSFGMRPRRGEEGGMLEAEPDQTPRSGRRAGPHVGHVQRVPPGVPRGRQG